MATRRGGIEDTTKDTAPLKLEGDGFSRGLERMDTDPEVEVQRWDGELRRSSDKANGRLTSPLQIVPPEGLGALLATPEPALGSISAVMAQMPEAMRVLEAYATSESGLGGSVEQVQKLILGLLSIINREVERSTQLRESLKKMLAELIASHKEKYTDALTGLPNQRALFEFVRRLFEVYRDPGIPFSIFLIDLDLFHDLNTKHGYEGGDFVLGELSRVLQEALKRSGDACFFPSENGLSNIVPTRAGGEEFMIVLPETDLAGAAAVAKRVWEAIGQHEFIFKGERIQVTASIGVTSVDYKTQRSFDDIRNPANDALKVCKEKSREKSGAIRGRNGVYQHDGKTISRVVQGPAREKSSRDTPGVGIRMGNLWYFAKKLFATIGRKSSGKSDKPKQITG